MKKKKKKRTEEEIDKLVDDFRGRMDWLEEAWGCRSEYEVDLATGKVWVKLTMPNNETALVIHCDVAGISVPGTEKRP